MHLERESFIVRYMTTKDLARHLSTFDLSESAVMATDLRAARAAMVPFRTSAGFKARSAKLLTAPNENLKLTHSGTDKVAAFGLSLAPADLSGDWNLCRYATKGCRAACLATAGNGRYGATQRGRIWKTKFLAANPLAFLRVLVSEIDAIKVDKWAGAGFTVSFRFNVLSDLPWESLAPWILRRLAERTIRSYDYTAWPSARRDRAAADLLGYHLVDSVKETHSDAQIRRMARPVVVFNVNRGRALPATYLGRPVIDADVSDARFLDAEGTVRGLRFKNVTTTARAAAVASGFVKAA